MSTKPRMVVALVICASMALGSCVRAPVEEVEESWISLFNGTDLTGWTPKFAGYEPGVNFRNTFRVENGILKVVYDEYDRFNGEFGHLFYNRRLSDYRLRVEYRFTGEQTPGGPEWGYRNSGVMIHGQTPDSMTLDQRFPVSIEVQLLGGDGKKERPTANLCTPGTHVEMGGELITRHCTDSVSSTFHGDVWVHVEIEVRGGRIIRHLVNGETVIEYAHPQLDGGDPDAQKLMEAGAETMLTGGTISIQAESHPLEFRRIELLALRKE